MRGWLGGLWLWVLFNLLASAPWPAEPYLGPCEAWYIEQLPGPGDTGPGGLGRYVPCDWRP